MSNIRLVDRTRTYPKAITLQRIQNISKIGTSRIFINTRNPRHVIIMANKKFFTNFVTNCFPFAKIFITSILHFSHIKKCISNSSLPFIINIRIINQPIIKRRKRIFQRPCAMLSNIGSCYINNIDSTILQFYMLINFFNNPVRASMAWS